MQSYAPQEVTTIFERPRSSSAKSPRALLVTRYLPTTYIRSLDPSELRGPLPTVRGPREFRDGAPRSSKETNMKQETRRSV